MVSFQRRMEQTVGARRVRFICAPNQYYTSFMRSALFWLAAMIKSTLFGNAVAELSANAISTRGCSSRFCNAGKQESD